MKKALVFGIVFRNNIKADNSQTDVESHLRRSQSNTVGVQHCFVHILYQFLQIRIICCNFLSLFAKNRLT